MLLTIQLRIQATDLNSLQILLQKAAEARDWMSDRAFAAGLHRYLDLHRLFYRDAKAKFGLPANLVQSLVRQVSVAASRAKGRVKIKFRPDSAVPLISRYIKRSGIGLSLKTTDGWADVSVQGSPEHLRLLEGNYRAGMLFCKPDGKFFLHLSVEVPEATEIHPSDVLGVDLGIVNLAVDSDGQTHTGKDIREKRRIYGHRRRNLQRNGSRSANRKLKRIGRKQSRYQRHVNHILSKQLVTKAHDTGRAIALENLQGIRGRVKVRRRQRNELSNWGFFQLRCFIEYKALRLGVPVVLVDPRNTSRGCPACGHVAKGNRVSRDEFLCGSCGHAGPADHIAARNIRARALADAPKAAAG